MYSKEFMVSTGFNATQDNYLFHEMALRVNRYCRTTRVAPINMGVGDVSVPLAPCVVQAMQSACAQMQYPQSFRGYPPPFGYDFLREAVVQYYGQMHVEVSAEDIYIGSGAKDDLARWCGLFDTRIPALLSNPTYPAHADIQRVVGRTIVNMPATADNGYLPMPYEVPARQYLILLCSPSNPTGAVYSPVQLQRWVDFALATKSIILYDAAYQRFADTPCSIMGVDNAQFCCIEINTLSKCASFSGMRCGWSVASSKLPEGVVSAYRKCLTITSNGVSYITQRAAEAALSAKGRLYQDKTIAQYRLAAKTIGDALYAVGVNAVCGPYVWVPMPYAATGWQYFDDFLQKGMVVTPGSGFGTMGEGHVRLSVFQLGDNTAIATRRIVDLLQQKKANNRAY